MGRAGESSSRGYMPELPEVETIRLGLLTLLPGRTIASVDIETSKSFPNDPSQIQAVCVGAQVETIERRGKGLIIGLSSQYSLLVHLKMTGQLVFRQPRGEAFGGGHPNDSLIGSLPDRSTRVTISFDDGSQLFFNDQRKFGWVKLVPTDEVFDEPFFAKLGPEIIAKDLTFVDFKHRLQRRQRTSIKAAILDQSVVAGVGNIYVDEGLFAARLHPATLVKDASSAKLKALYEGLREVMALSIRLGGSSDRNYVDAEGNKGSYLKFAKVFRREGLPCERCGQSIDKTRVAGRGTHICTRCQKPPRVRSQI